MKMKSFLVSMLTLAALASCSNDDDLVTGGNPDQNSDGAYLAVSVDFPQGGNTRADSGPGSNTGTTAESTVSKIVVYCFNSSKAKAAREGVVVASVADAAAAFKVPETTANIFLVANPSVKLQAKLDAAGSYTEVCSVINSAATDYALGTMNTSGTFVMTNEGTLTGVTNVGDVSTDDGLVAVTPVVVGRNNINTAADAIAAAKAEDKIAKVWLDRILAKVQLEGFTAKNSGADANVPAGATVTVDGWKLNTTNKQFGLFHKLVKYANSSATGTAGAAKYRQDMNWTALALTKANPILENWNDAAYAFNWLHNYGDAPVWNTFKGVDITGAPAAKEAEYCHENTMTADRDNQNYGNSTKMVIKAHYTPKESTAGTTITAGQTWFYRAGVIYANLAEMNVAYTDPNVAQELKDDFDAFAVAVLKDALKTKTFADLMAPGFTLPADAAYLAATADVPSTNAIVRCYYESVCYYDPVIKHDNTMPLAELGRWGVVRNNWYGLNITKITKPGLPYIPDPTDPDITDPDNPDPTTPDDAYEAYIAVTVTVNPWTTWMQDVEL